MKLRLPHLKEDFELPQGRTLIGRLPECDIVLGQGEAAVSRTHAEIKVEGADVSIRDRGSRNGSKLNGKALAGQDWRRIKSQDRLQICKYELVFFDDRIPDPSQGSCIVVPGNAGTLPHDTASISISSLALAGTGTHDRLGQLRALLRITQALRGILKTEDVLARTAQILLDIFPNAERAVIGFVDEAAKFVPRWWHLRREDPTAEIQISQTVVKQVIDTGQAIMTNEASKLFPNVESVHALSLKSIMCAPLLDEQNRISGIVHVDAQTPGKFNALDLEVLAMIATQISLALGYSRLHEQTVHDRILLHDLQRAREVQLQYLPKEPPEIPGYDISCFYRAARQVGGDYYDFISLPNNRLALVQGDVEGKGAPAALTMVRLATETRAGLEICSSPAELLTRMNERITEKWVTFVAVFLDTVSNTIEIANAGHEYPIVRRQDGRVEELTENCGGTPLSVVPGEKYCQEVFKLHSGEILVMFSDGFPDAEQSKTGSRFGKKRLIELLESFTSSTDNFPEQVAEAVDQFRSTQEQFDDMCMICLRRL